MDNKLSRKNRNIAILTSGGDAPGMNMVVLNLLRYLYFYQYDAYIIKQGLCGLINNHIVRFDYSHFYDLQTNLFQSGTIIQSSRCDEFKIKKKFEQALSNLKRNRIDTLIILGGDGSFQAVKKLIEANIKVIAVPASIDNDLLCSQLSVGFYSTLQYMTKHVQDIINTAKSFNSYFIVEIMGNNNINLAVNLAQIVFADALITKDNVWNVNDYVHAINELKKINKNWGIFIVQEKVYGSKVPLTYKEIIQGVNDKTNERIRLDSVSYIQRSTSPSGIELLNASKISEFIVKKMLNKGFYNKAVCFVNDKLKAFEIDINNQKSIQKENKNKLKEINQIARQNYFK